MTFCEPQFVGTDDVRKALATVLTKDNSSTEPESSLEQSCFVYNVLTSLEDIVRARLIFSRMNEKSKLGYFDHLLEDFLDRVSGSRTDLVGGDGKVMLVLQVVLQVPP